ncbi:MAG TPA: hypothetical protein VFQ39_20015 [Longimicrobium sp.]|nr:hypothetical protein [Longimicrobium sp.]
MPSKALHTWNTSSRRALDEIVAAHAALVRARRGRRYATRQVNHAYVVLLASQFQRFCRDLHTEAVGHLVAQIGSVSIATIVYGRMTGGRKLDVGNANPGNIGSDFGHLDLNLWASVRGRDSRNRVRQELLAELNAWRNAIAHQDFRHLGAGGAHHLRIDSVRRWRAACTALAVDFDAVVRLHLLTVTGTTPW